MEQTRRERSKYCWWRRQRQRQQQQQQQNVMDTETRGIYTEITNKSEPNNINELDKGKPW